MPADCGVKVDVFIRPKIGFCNCSTGVSDDNELERVADTDLVSAKVRPLGPGSPVKIGWMRGLSRLYRVSDGEGAKARRRSPIMTSAMWSWRSRRSATAIPPWSS
jgi:hypothetical protein